MNKAKQADSPYVTVTVESTRESWQALLDKEGTFEQTYTPLGIVWSNLMQAARNALGEPDGREREGRP